MYQVLLSMQQLTSKNIKVFLMTGYLLFLQALNVVASEVMVGDTCIPSLIVINTTNNQLKTNIL